MPKPLAPVKPIPRESKPPLPQQQTLSIQERADMEQFLGRHQLQELLQIFMREVITLTDVLEMTEETMKEVGVIKFALRKRLVGAVRDERGDSSSSSGVPLEQLEEHAPVRAVRAEERRLRPTATFAEDMQEKCQLEEVQSSSSR